MRFASWRSMFKPIGSWRFRHKKVKRVGAWNSAVVRVRPWNGHQVDQTNRAQQSSVRRFSATPTDVLPWLASVVRRVPGYNFMQRRGTVRIPPQTQRPHQNACIQSRIRSCDHATLGSNPRKPFKQSMPSHIFVINEVKPLYSHP